MIRSLNAVAGATAFALLSSTCLAGPQNPTVAHGTAVFQQVGNFYLIQASDGSIINYTSFNIAPFETVQFQQPNANATVLNRINGVSPTSINGNLLANGIVFFVNPAGVVFGNNAVVNVGGIYAAAADISNADFMAGNISGSYTFTNIDGNVLVNPGAQIAGANMVHLIGQQIANHGTISVGDGGIITMTANNGTVTIAEIGGNYSVSTTPGAAFAGVGVENTGTLDASTNGRIMLGAGDMYSIAVRMEDTGNFGMSANVVDINGPTELASNITIESELATFNGDLQSVGGNHSLTISDGGIYAQADAEFNGAVGGPLGPLTNALGNITVGNDVVFNDTVQTMGNVVSQNGNATFNNATNIQGGVNAAGFTQFADDGNVAGSVIAGDFVSFGNNANVGGGVNAVNGSVTFGENAFVLLNVNAGTDVTFGNLGTVLLGSVNAQTGDVTFGDLAFVGGNVTADQNVSFLGVSQVAGNVTATTGNAQFAGNTTLGGNVTAGNDVLFQANGTFNGLGLDQTVDAGGELRATGTLTSTLAGDLTLRGAAGIFLDDVVHVQDGNLTIENMFVALADLLASGDIELQGTGEFAGVDQSVIAGGLLLALASLEKTQDGNLILQGDVVELQDLLTHSALGNIDISGPNGITLSNTVDVQGGNLTLEHAFTALGNLLASGAISLQGAGTFSGVGDQDVIAGGLLEALAALEKDSAGNLLIQGDVVDLQSLLTHIANGNITINGLNGIMLGDTVHAQSGNLTIEHAFSAVGHLLASGDIALQGNGNFIGLGVDQTVDAGGQLLAMGNLTSSELGDLILQGAGGIQLDGNVDVQDGGLHVVGNLTLNGDQILSTGDQTYDGAVMLGAGNKEILSSDGDIAFNSTIDGPGALTVGATNAFFRGDIGAGTALDSFETIVTGFTTIDSSLIQAINNIVFNDQVTLAAIPVTATIGASGDLQILSLNGDFIMGQNQKMAVLGDLEILATNGSATLGDLSTLGDMTVTANAIFLLTREPGTVLTSGLVLEDDQGLDFVAGGLFFFSVVPTIIGDGIVQFSNPNGDGDQNGTLSTFLMRAFGEPITADMILGADGTYFDLRAQGPATTDLSRGLAAALPDESELEEVDDEVQLSASDIDLLRAISIPVRVLNPAELTDLIDGRGIYLDGAPTEILATVPEVAINRMLTSYVSRVSDSYVELFGAIPADADRTRERQVADALDQPWSMYVSETAGDPAGFGNYLAARTDDVQAATALEHLRSMRQLQRDMEALGLTATEARNLPMEAIYPRLRPENMTADQLRQAVESLPQE
jgi:filamentous hemagglutinin family protein